jgi:hypothetical protein
VSRVIHYRLHGLAPERLDRVHEQFNLLASAREWRTEAPFLASDASTGLFEMEYLRLQRHAEGENISAAGFMKLAGDEIDALIVTLFVRDLSAEYGIRTVQRDEGHPIAKLRYLEFRNGRLASGNSLEEMLARRPVIKKVMGQAIFFYPPRHPLNQGFTPSRPGEWGYALQGLRAYAPTLLEAEREALKILRGWRRLGGR